MHPYDLLLVAIQRERLAAIGEMLIPQIIPIDTEQFKAIRIMRSMVALSPIGALAPCRLVVTADPPNVTASFEAAVNIAHFDCDPKERAVAAQVSPVQANSPWRR